jgi:hypothetical protein
MLGPEAHDISVPSCSVSEAPAKAALQLRARTGVLAVYGLSYPEEIRFAICTLFPKFEKVRRGLSV